MRTAALLMLLVASAAVLAVSGQEAVAAPADQSITTTDGYKVDFVGNSGQFKLYPADGKRFLQVKWDAIEELDGTTKTANKVTNLAGATWATPEVVEYEVVNAEGNKVTVNATKVSLTRTVLAATTFQVDTYVFADTVTVPYGNTTITVPRNNLKFNVIISNWPFLKTSNTLNLVANVLTPGNNAAKRTAAANGEVDYDFDEAYILVADQATVNEVDTVNVTSSSSDQGSHQLLNLVFPSFEGTLDYDPTVGMGPAKKSGAAAAASPFVALLLAAIAALALRQ